MILRWKKTYFGVWKIKINRKKKTVNESYKIGNECGGKKRKKEGNFWLYSSPILTNYSFFPQFFPWVSCDPNDTFDAFFTNFEFPYLILHFFLVLARLVFISYSSVSLLFLTIYLYFSFIFNIYYLTAYCNISITFNLFFYLFVSIICPQSLYFLLFSINISISFNSISISLSIFP